MMWPKAPYRWVENGREHISVAFTFDLPVLREELQTRSLFYGKPIVGGPAVKLMPEYLADVAEIGGEYPGILHRMNPLATRTTIGCPNHCGFCAVPQLEPDFQELSEWPVAPIVCDNNLLAASRAHFDRVIDSLKGLEDVDFNQGLDARLLTDHHADRMRELNCLVRLAWDDTRTEHAFLRAFSRLRRAGIPRARIQAYVLIGYNDMPEDALYRLETCWYALGILPNPMRYVPLDSLTRHYTGPGWTHKELTAMQRYWSNITKLNGVRYEQWRDKEAEG